MRRKSVLAALVAAAVCLLGIAAIYIYVLRSVAYVSPLQMATSRALKFEMILESLDEGNVDCARELVDRYLRSEVVLLESLLEREQEEEARDRAEEVLARIERFDELGRGPQNGETDAEALPPALKQIKPSACAAGSQARPTESDGSLTTVP